MQNEDLYPPTIMIKNADLNTSWALAVYTVNKYGKVIQSSPNYTDDPDYVPPLTKDVCATIEYTGKAIQDIKNRVIHPAYPHHDGYKAYENQFRPGTTEYENARGFHYSYGLRMREYRGFIDQLEFIAENLDPYNKRMQVVTWDVEVDLPATIMDEMKQSVPCYQRLQVRDFGNGFYDQQYDWRSRDLFKAYEWNILGLVNTVDEVINETRLRQGKEQLSLIKVTDKISSLHIYQPEWDAASKIRVSLQDFNRCVFM